ncbi:MAG: universal stress protein, partial [Pseudomonadota bacterium]
MSTYRKLLVAVDLSEESDKVLKRALDVVDGDDQRLSLIHVVEPVAAAYPIDAYAINMTRLQEEALSIAARRLADFASNYGIPESRQYALMGPAATEIRAKAEEENADLIVIGSHGTSGWKLLLGSTANKVLHGASCDIL